MANYALEFSDLTASRVQDSDFAANPFSSNEFEVTARFKTTDNTIPRQVIWVAIYGQHGRVTDCNCALELLAGQIRYTRYTTGHDFIIDAAVIPNNTWVTAKVVQTLSGRELWVNDVLVDSDTMVEVGTATNQPGLTLGSNDSGSSHRLDGQIDFVHCVDTSASALKLTLDLNEGTGTKTYAADWVGVDVAQLLDGATWASLGGGQFGLRCLGDNNQMASARRWTTTSGVEKYSFAVTFYDFLSNGGIVENSEYTTGVYIRQSANSGALNVFAGGSNHATPFSFSLSTRHVVEVTVNNNTNELIVVFDGTSDTQTLLANTSYPDPDETISIGAMHTFTGNDGNCLIEYLHLEDVGGSYGREYDFNEGAGDFAKDNLENTLREFTYISPPAADAQWILLAAGGNNFTGDISATQAAQTAGIVGTVADPTFAGSMASTQAVQTSSINGVNTLPAGAGSLTGSQAAQTSVMAGALTIPTFTGAGVSTQAAQNASASGAFSITDVTGNVTSTQAVQNATMSGAVTEPTGVMISTQAVQTASGVGTFSTPVSEATILSTQAPQTTVITTPELRPAELEVAGNILAANYFITEDVDNDPVKPALEYRLTERDPITLVGGILNPVTSPVPYIPKD